MNNCLSYLERRGKEKIPSKNMNNHNAFLCLLFARKNKLTREFRLEQRQHTSIFLIICLWGFYRCQSVIKAIAHLVNKGRLSNIWEACDEQCASVGVYGGQPVDVLPDLLQVQQVLCLAFHDGYHPGSKE